MVDEVWLHIGAPKTGTSALQKRFLADRDMLAEQGLAYLTPPNKSSANDLAVAFNRKRPELADLAAGLNQQIDARREERALISSEMFYGFSPEVLFGLMPALADRPLKILVYLRRQDRFIEAMFLQKSKNGRFFGSVADYIEKFQGSGSDFQEMLAPWEHTKGNVALVPRVMERAKLTGGDLVPDACDLIGLPPPDPRENADVNVSPGLHRVQLLQAAAAVGLGNPRRLQRVLSARFPQDPKERAPILNHAEKLEYLARFEAGNETLRARYFPGYDTLFDMSDLENPQENNSIPPFTSAQLSEIVRLLQVVKDLS